MKVALFVTPDDQDRVDYARECQNQDLRALLTTTLFEAMSVVGRTEIGAIIFPVGKRLLAARGLCQLAERHHPEAKIFAIRDSNVSVEDVYAAFPDPRTEVIDIASPKEIVAHVAAVLGAQVSEDRYDATDPIGPALLRGALDLDGDTESGPAVFTNGAVNDVFSDQSVDDDTMPLEIPSIALAATRRHQVTEDATIVLDRAFLSGDLMDTPGVELLMSLSVQHLSGRLVVDGVATIYFERGDPVWAEHRDGPSGWLRELRHMGRVRAGMEQRCEDEFELLRLLSDGEHLQPDDAEDVIGELLMTAVQRVLDAGRGAFAFFECAPPLTNPRVKLGAFEVVLTRIRRTFDAKEIKRRGKQLRSLVLFPTSALAALAPELANFVGGRDLALYVDGEADCASIWRGIGLSDAAGALLVIALIEARLATFDGVPLSMTGRVALSPATGIVDAIDPAHRAPYWVASDSDSNPTSP